MADLTYDSKTEDPVKFKTFEPKIKAYRDALAAAMIEEYKIPESELPPLGGSGIDLPKKFLSESEYAITESAGTDLVKKIASGELTSVEVFKAFAKRATIAHQVTNCAMQIFMDEGLKRAEELDAYYKETGKTVGPLHGLPVSLKEHYNYKGKVTHGAFVSLIENVTDNYSLTVEILLEQGAVFYIRTTEPQCLMHLCSNNNITGLCLNPHNTSLSTGGSSSGEGAIAAMKGSVFGLGSDIGGSIRAPAAFCGVWGLRPTQKRLSMKNITGPGSGVQDSVACVLGPLGRSAADLNLFMKASIAGEPWKRDPMTIPLPWKDVSTPKASEITVGIMYDDGVVKPTPPMLRALKTAAEKLKAAGFKVVEWKPFDVEKLVEACGSMYNSDFNEGQKKYLRASGEPLTKLSKTALTFGCGDEGLSGKGIQEVCYIRDKGRQDYQDSWAKEGIDYILCPTYANVAPKQETIKYWGYTNLWNVLDFPNVIFPTGLSVDPELDVVDNTYVPRNDVEKYEYSLYTGPEDFKNAPIALQLTGRRWFDEDLVAASDIIQAAIAA